MKHPINTYTILCVAAISAIAAGCSDTTFRDGTEETAEPITIYAGYPVASRATESGFEDRDRIGVFADIAGGDRIAENVEFTFDERNDRWNSGLSLYWPSKSAVADIVGYYPYTNTLSDPSAYEFTIKQKQGDEEDGMAGYEASDLLWAKADKVKASDGKIMLNFRHVMAGVTIRIEKGAGFEADEWEKAEKRVYIPECRTAATVNLETGTVTTKDDVKAYVNTTEYNGEYRAVIPPQTFDADCKLVGIDINGRPYTPRLFHLK